MRALWGLALTGQRCLERRLLRPRPSLLLPSLLMLRRTDTASSVGGARYLTIEPCKRRSPSARRARETVVTHSARQVPRRPLALLLPMNDHLLLRRLRGLTMRRIPR